MQNNNSKLQEKQLQSDPNLNEDDGIEEINADNYDTAKKSNPEVFYQTNEPMVKQGHGTGTTGKMVFKPSTKKKI